MAITRNFTSGSPPAADRVTSNTIAILVTNAVAAGDLIVVPASWEDGSTTVINSITDTSGNTYVQAGSNAVDPNSPSSSAVWCCLSAHAASANTNTVTLHMSNAVLTSAAIQSVTSSVAVTWSIDKTTGTSGTATPLTSASVTTTSANEYVACSAYGDGASTTASGSITPQFTHTPLGGLSFEATGDAILTSTTSIAATFSYGGGNFSVAMATFAATSASAPTQAPSTSFPDSTSRSTLPSWAYFANTAEPPYPLLDPLRSRRAFPGPAGLGGFLLFGLNLDQIVPTGDFHPSFPERVSAASLATAQQMASSWNPSPPATALTPGPLSAFPDRATALGSVAVGYAELPPAPERTQAMAEVAFPERVPPVATLAASWWSDPVAPERTSLLAVTSYPDRFVPPLMPASLWAEPPAPEQTIALWAPQYPDRTIANRLAPASTWAALNVLPAPERTAAAIVAAYPDAVAQPRLPSSWLGGDIAPERTAPIASAFFPDRAVAIALTTAAHLAWTEESPAPEQVLSAPRTSFPDSLPRPSVPPSAWALYPLPLPTTTLFANWLPSYPGATTGTSLRAADRPFATEVSPAPERNAPYWATSYPDRVDRPALAPGHHLAATGQTPAPERTATLAATGYPDRVWAPSVFVGAEPSAAFIRIEGSAPTDWEPFYPERTFRLALVPAEFPYLAFAPAPERTGALAASAYPDRVPRVALETRHHLAATELAPAPEGAGPRDWSASYPDATWRPGLAPAQLPFYGASSAPERLLPMAATQFSDATWAPALRTSAQLAATELSPFPIPNTALAYWWPSYPDRTTRPALATGAHLASIDVSPNPIPTPYGWVPAYPDRVPGPALPRHAMPYAQTTPRPEGAIANDWGPSYPHATSAPKGLLVAQHQHASVAPETPERRSPLAWSTFPDAIHRPTLATADILAMGAMGPAPERTLATWVTSFPDRIKRQALPIAAHPPWGMWCPLPIPNAPTIIFVATLAETSPVRGVTESSDIIPTTGVTEPVLPSAIVTDPIR